jgi:cyclopropane fatty-acyl-phospholipid synthase-like methyltransferase
MSPRESKSATHTTPKNTKKKMSQRADRHVLYEKAVQCAEAEIDFVEETFRQLRKRKARWLREDFCGTALTACEWVRRRKYHHAIGVDLDAEVQQWGRENHIAGLGRAARRIELLTEDVLRVRCQPVDIVLAMNFSYWVFKERPLLRRYFANVYRGLTDDGILMLDAYGGSDAHREIRERTPMKGFTYVWHQKNYDPVTGDILCHIHFTFPDGSRIRKAFTYDWRLWSLPELKEVLMEAGFRRVTVYWEGTDEETGEGNGEYTPTEHGEADPAFVVYLVAEK